LAFSRSPIPSSGPIVLADPLVAVGVIDRRDEQDQPLEDRVAPPGDQVADHHRQCFLAVDLPGVDVAEEEHHELARRLRLGRRGNGRVADDH
jgi:hypothetical protein